MKMTIADRTCKIIAENPDDRFTQHVRSRVRDALAVEWSEFFEEVAVALRSLEDGQTVTVESKPISVEISRAHEPEKAPIAT